MHGGSQEVDGTPGRPRALISFDIDGTLEFGQPPGSITVEVARRARDLGFLIGSCSDRPLSTQRDLWREAGIEVDFVVLKQNLPLLRADFVVGSGLHVGDTELDERMAALAGFDFLHVRDAGPIHSWLDDFLARWLDAGGDSTPARAESDMTDS